MKPSELVLMASLGLSPSEAAAELARLEPALINLAHLYPVAQGQVTATTLNVRAEPNVSAAVLGKLTKSAVVAIWGQTADAQWLVVEAGDLAGWVSREWVRLER